MDYQGIFFDFDYTLGDSTAAIAQGYQLGFSALGPARAHGGAGADHGGHDAGERLQPGGCGL